MVAVDIVEMVEFELEKQMELFVVLAGLGLFRCLTKFILEGLMLEGSNLPKTYFVPFPRSDESYRQNPFVRAVFNI